MKGNLTSLNVSIIFLSLHILNQKGKKCHTRPPILKSLSIIQGKKYTQLVFPQSPWAFKLYAQQTRSKFDMVRAAVNELSG